MRCGVRRPGVSTLLLAPLLVSTAHAAAWNETILSSLGDVGSRPYGGLAADAKGHLYGTTMSGGQHGFGAIYELSPPAHGQTAWTTKVIFNFTAKTGGYPDTSLLLDTAGNLYGTLGIGGDSGGEVFELARPSGGKGPWTFSIL